jgi:ABC-type branched-subunit amino acid transport system ATPase component
VSLIEVQEVAKSYGGIRALDRCTMEFEEGKINGLIGPNGSGKTTLFNVLTGYERADGGRIHHQGEDISALSPDRVFARGIGRTFQLTRVFSRMTVVENLHVAAQRAGGFRSELSRWSSSSERAKAKEVLDFVGLTRLAAEMAGNLSYGQQKLLEFAAIMIAEPRVILLDEPAGGVNPTLLTHLASRIQALNAEGTTFVVVEHDMEFVMGLCHRVCVMHQGRALCAGNPEEVRADPLVLEAYLGTDMRPMDAEDAEVS